MMNDQQNHMAEARPSRLECGVTVSRCRAPPKSSLERLNDDNAYRTQAQQGLNNRAAFQHLCLLIDDTTFECERGAYDLE
jgi:hypothetical protein